MKNHLTIVIKLGNRLEIVVISSNGSRDQFNHRRNNP
jgi:hypothetical protein